MHNCLGWVSDPNEGHVTHPPLPQDERSHLETKSPCSYRNMSTVILSWSLWMVPLACFKHSPPPYWIFVFRNEKVQFLITTGDKKFYSNGLDQEFLATCTPEEFIETTSLLHKVLARLLSFPMLTVAALNGRVLPIRLLILCVDSLMVQGGYVIQFFFLGFIWFQVWLQLINTIESLKVVRKKPLAKDTIYFILYKFSKLVYKKCLQGGGDN